MASKAVADGGPMSFAVRQGLVFACLYVGYAMYVYNRRSFSFVLPAVVEQESLTSYELGFIFSAQHLAYAGSKLIAGFMSDQFHVSLMFSVGLFMTGMFSLAFVDSESLLTFVVTSFLNGLAQGFGWPPAAKILRQWFHPGQFGFWWGLLSTSMNVAAALGHPLATFLAINHGWHVAIQMPAILSMGFAILFYIAVHSKPSECGHVDQLPALRATQAGGSSGATAPRNQWTDLLHSPFTWLLAISYMVVFCIRTSVQDWVQLYLVHDLGQPTFTASAFLSAVETGGIAGTVASGLFSDLLVRSASWAADPKKSARMVVLQAEVAGIAVCLNLFLFTITGQTSYYWIVVLGFLVGFSIYGAINLFGVITMEVAPQHLAGSAHAVVSFSANVGGVLSGVPISLVARYFSWFGAFVLLEVACLAAFLTMLVAKDLPAVMVPQEVPASEKTAKSE